MYSLIYLFIYQLIYLKFLARSKISGANNTKADLCEQETKIEALRENMVYMPSIEELKSLDYKFDELLERIRITKNVLTMAFQYLCHQLLLLLFLLFHLQGALHTFWTDY